MAEKISELTGEAREKRIAELKKKMQEAAQRAQAAHAAGDSAATPAAPAAPARAPAAQATAERVVEAAPAEEATTGGNGAAAPRPTTAPATITAPKPAAKPAPTPAPASEAAVSPEEMNRREFLTYAWGAALGVLTLEVGVVSFFFMYPRFRAGEFGGKFFLQQSEVPDPSAAPIPNTTGKFWLVSTEEGAPKALYMVCTHLGCLYKWEPSNVRFECPCHGSKFTHDGFYIEGPAPRSLDYFEISEEGDQIVVDTGARIIGDPSSESPARAEA